MRVDRSKFIQDCHFEPPPPFFSWLCTPQGVRTVFVCGIGNSVSAGNAIVRYYHEKNFYIK